MTVNERLKAAGLLSPFDQAGKARDRDGMITVLQQAGFGDQAIQIADAVLANPELYGF